MAGTVQVVLDADQREIRINGDEIHRLTPTEHRILALLLAAHGSTVTYEEFAEAFGWPRQLMPAAKVTLKAHIVRIRKLLGDLAIINVWGHGYRLNEQFFQPCPTCGRIQ